ncbi:MAG: patatin-like phospholipase family protein, partial [Candidatus Obscuribacterales bacterium]|nr:patatin-like phospholipase family protein [Candidatus Obscuribacterales bacterium]
MYLVGVMMKKRKALLCSSVLASVLLWSMGPVLAEQVAEESSARDANCLSTPNKIDVESRQDFAMPAHQPKVIVALGGGGFKSVAQIGVLRSLEKHNIHIDGIIGTSMGALIGSLYCSGHSLDEIENMFLDTTVQKSFNEHLVLKTALRPLAHLSYFFRTRPYGGLTDAKKCSHLLQKKLPSSFNDLKIPFAAVATDLTDGRTRVLGSCELP